MINSSHIPKTQSLHTYTYKTTYFSEQINTICNIIAGLPSSNNSAAKWLRNFLFEHNYLDTDGATPDGLKFLFSSSSSQCWSLVLSYMSKINNDENIKALRFLFRLSFLNVGECYEIGPDELKFVKEMEYFGLVHLEKNHFFPTAGATYLSASSEGESEKKNKNNIEGQTNEDSDGFILLETAFRLYSYSTSKLVTKLISRFAQCECILPNLSVWKITKETVSAAFKLGITAKSIITYIQSNAHWRMSVLPSNVIEQIKIWENEMCRYKSTESILFDEFENIKEYEECAKLCKSDILFSNDKKLILVLTPDGAYKYKNQFKIR